MIGNGVNIGLNYLFIFQLGWGFAGCAAATTITRFLMLLLIYRHVKRSSEAFGIYAELGELVRDTPIENAAHGAAHVLNEAQLALENVPVQKARQSLGQGLFTLGRTLGVTGMTNAGEYLEGDEGVEMSRFMSRLWDGDVKRDRRKNTASVMPFDTSSDHSNAGEASCHGSERSGSEDSDTIERNIRAERPLTAARCSIAIVRVAVASHSNNTWKVLRVGSEESLGDYLDGVLLSLRTRSTGKS